MRVLLDEQIPAGFGVHLTGHDVVTVKAAGWAGLKNGELLLAAEQAGFKIFVTMDRNLQFQQNLSSLAIGVVLLRSRSTSVRDLLPLVPALLALLPQVEVGDLHVVGG